MIEIVDHLYKFYDASRFRIIHINTDSILMFLDGNSMTDILRQDILCDPEMQGSLALRHSKMFSPEAFLPEEPKQANTDGAEQECSLSSGQSHQSQHQSHLGKMRKKLWLNEDHGWQFEALSAYNYLVRSQGQTTKRKQGGSNSSSEKLDTPLRKRLKLGHPHGQPKKDDSAGASEISEFQGHDSNGMAMRTCAHDEKTVGPGGTEVRGRKRRLHPSRAVCDACSRATFVDRTGIQCPFVVDSFCKEDPDRF